MIRQEGFESFHKDFPVNENLEFYQFQQFYQFNNFKLLMSSHGALNNPRYGIRGSSPHFIFVFRSVQHSSRMIIVSYKQPALRAFERHKSQFRQIIESNGSQGCH